MTAWQDPSEGLSIVIPTFNERDNIVELVTRLRFLSTRLDRPLEVVLVDDSSPDGTAELAERLSMQLGMDLHVLAREGERSLGGAIAAGLRMCRWNLVCVMDADLSHPVDLIPSLVDALGGVDTVVASRYVSGGMIDSWPFVRRMASAVATVMARICLRVDCRDPLSGFFLIRRSLLRDATVTGEGNKPLLEILVSAKPAIREVPYQFHNRRNGKSKLDSMRVIDFVRLIARLRPAASNGSRPWVPGIGR